MSPTLQGIMSFYEDIDFARSIMIRIFSYLVSLLDVGKSSHMACFIVSPIGGLSCKATPSSVWREVLSTLRIHRPTSPWSTSGWGSFAKKIC